MNAPGSISLVRGEAGPVVLLAGEIDVYAVKSVSADDLEKYRTDGPLTVDLGEVTFLDSIGIGFLIELRKYADHVRLDNASSRTRALLAMVGVEGKFSYDHQSPFGAPAAGSA